VIRPRLITGERVRVQPHDLAGGEDVLPEPDVPPEVRIRGNGGTKTSEERDQDKCENQEWKPIGAHRDKSTTGRKPGAPAKVPSSGADQLVVCATEDFSVHRPANSMACRGGAPAFLRLAPSDGLRHDPC
jgi:hypothetical protein